ncbi:hypothetical protein L484_002378 [Morus notabilis]|uniref:Uncharacterized protein n=1 Tax=Morus notabilis TaxID=981085 RepID=W9SI50_9ROSA|nr:hypothetical protein L484_002378 [Morus notabilis]
MKAKILWLILPLPLLLFTKEMYRIPSRMNSGIFMRLRPKVNDASTISTLSSDQKTTTIKEN